MKDIAKLLANKGLVTSQGGYEMAENFFAQFGDEDTAFVAYHSAPAGFEAFSVIFGDSVPMRLVLKAENALRMEAGAEMVTRRQMDGRMVMYFTAPLYPKIGAVIIGGGAEPTIDWWGLKLTMPEGGTVILRKYADPNAVSLEVSTDGTNWQPWELVGSDYSYTLQAGDTLCIRNTSETPTGFSRGSNKYYSFVLDNLTYATGEVRSLLVRDENTAVSTSSYVFRKLFSNCPNLITPPELNFSSYNGTYCFSAMFENSGITKTPTLGAETVTNSMYREMFYGCNNLSEATTYMTTLGSSSLLMWMYGVAPTGDFYCPQSLVIPTGSSGIPSGWTRHDI